MHTSSDLVWDSAIRSDSHSWELKNKVHFVESWREKKSWMNAFILIQEVSWRCKTFRFSSKLNSLCGRKWDLIKTMGKRDCFQMLLFMPLKHLVWCPCAPYNRLYNAFGYMCNDLFHHSVDRIYFPLNAFSGTVSPYVPCFFQSSCFIFYYF